MKKKIFLPSDFNAGDRIHIETYVKTEDAWHSLGYGTVEKVNPKTLQMWTKMDDISVFDAGAKMYAPLNLRATPATERDAA